MTDRLKNVLDKIDEVNSQDTNIEVTEEGTKHPKELIYGIRMSEMLKNTFNSSSELLQIAARGQHIERWKIPRSDFPMDRKGYLKWRTQLKIFHGDKIAGIMKATEFLSEEISYTKTLLMKSNLKTNEDTQILEDTICLVFLKYYIEGFIKGKEHDKVIGIVRKTWIKMSEKARKEALKLTYSKTTESILTEALT